MQNIFEISGREVTVEKTGARPFINGRPSVELLLREEQIDGDGRRNGYAVSRMYVGARATWAEIETAVRHFYA